MFSLERRLSLTRRLLLLLLLPRLPLTLLLGLLVLLVLRGRKELVLLLHCQLRVHQPSARREALHLLELHLRL